MSDDNGFSKCRSPWDYVAEAQRRGAEVTIDGNTATIHTDKGDVHVRTCPRAMGKQERGFFDYLMWALGLIATIAGAIFLFN